MNLICFVRYWPIAEIALRTAHVRFRGQSRHGVFAEVRFRSRYRAQSGHAYLHRAYPVLTQSGHFART
jgi:hypothetical protein